MFNNFSAQVRATRDAETKQFGQTPACVVSLVNSTNQKVGDQWVENPLFFKGIVFGNPSERLAKVRKGDTLIVTGQLVNRKYTDKSGEERSDLNLEIARFEIIPVMKKATSSSSDGIGDLPF